MQPPFLRNIYRDWASTTWKNSPKYYTWVEQQGKTYEEIQKQWDDDQYWESIPTCVDQIDALIEEFNAKTGLVDKL
jgi:hypothetical protein